MNNQLTPVTRCTMTVEESATYLGLSKDTIYKLCREKRIDHYRIGKRILFKRESLDEWFNDLLITGTQENYAI